MATNSSTQFPDFVGSAPAPFREFLNSALQLRDLKALYSEAKRSGGASLSRSVLDHLQITVQVSPEDLQRVPHSGPVVVVANHPFGFLDGLVLDSLLIKTRPDVKILANELLCSLSELQDRCLPVQVFNSARAARVNIRSTRKAMMWLREGNGIAIFPAGEVSSWNKPYPVVADPPWHDFAARAALATSAVVVPVFFSGTNSLAFHVAGLIHPKLRTAGLPHELLNKRGRCVEVRIGTPICPEELASKGSAERVTTYLRARTYTLAHRQNRPALASANKRQPEQRPKLAICLPGERPAPKSHLAEEIERIQQPGKPLLEIGSYALYNISYDQSPLIMNEIGKLRENTFAAVGEGAGKTIDLDKFDHYYNHLVLWHKDDKQVAGSYRLAWTADVLKTHGIKGLYTSTLFRYHPRFFEQLGNAVELGRSFVAIEYQKEALPLLALWQGILQLVSRRPEAPILFGAVSISAQYPAASRALLVRYLRDHCFRHDLAPFVSPRRAFKTRLLRSSELSAVAASLTQFHELAGPLSDMGTPSSLPVLLRQYLKVGGQVAAFHLDRGFSDTLDALLAVDLRKSPSKLVTRYLGQPAPAIFATPLGT